MPVSPKSGRSLATGTTIPRPIHTRFGGLNDGFSEKGAAGCKWRTTPLWGLSLTRRVNPWATFQHDGRARTLDEAIRWPAGEADQSRKRYLALNPRQRDELIRWLEQL